MKKRVSYRFSDCLEIPDNLVVFMICKPGKIHESPSSYFHTVHVQIPSRDYLNILPIKRTLDLLLEVSRQLQNGMADSQLCMIKKDKISCNLIIFNCCLSVNTCGVLLQKRREPLNYQKMVKR